MSTSPGSELNPELIENLLALETREQQSAFLRAANLLHADGLSQLLDVAAHLVRRDPGQARRLADLCADMADSAAAAAAAPRATYIRAQTHAINGELNIALSLIKSARQGYAALGEDLEALRTNVGLMSVLNDMGRYQKALDAGQTVIDALDRAGELDVALASPESNLLAALVHQNRGVSYRRMGRYEEALSAYAAAEPHYLALGMTEHIGDISNNRGIVLLNLGRGSEALASFEAAAAIRAEAGLTLLHAETLINIGDAHLLLGNYTRSLDTLEQARRLFDSLEALADKHVLLLDTADAYLALNLYPEALAAYREADSLLQTAGMAHYRARALWGMGSALIVQSQLEAAERVLAEAASLFAAADNVPLLSSVMLEQAALLAARADRDTALATARQALALVTGNDWPVQRIYAHMRIADLLQPDVAKAEPHLVATQQLADRLALPHLRYRLNQRLGQLRLLQGRVEESQVLLEAAVDEIERLRGTLAQEVVRTSFLRDKTAAYEGLVQLHLARGDEGSVRQAFAVAERAKSRVLVDLITNVIETKPATPTEPDLAAQLQALQADLNAIYNEMLGSTGDSERRIPLPELHARAVELEQEISRLRLHATAGTAPADPFEVSLPLDAIQAQLPPEVVLLAYHLVGDEIMAFISARGRIRVVRRLSTAAVVQRLLQRLTAQWDRFRAGRAFVDRHMTLLERSTQRVLASLHDELMAPLEAVLDEAADLPSREDGSPRKLAIVPHGLLHQVPFHALFDGEQYLLERFEISYAPSATVLALCQARAPRHSGKALVLGVPDSLIPSVAAEACSVARHLDGAEVRVNGQATLAALQAQVPGCDVVHLACHGLFRTDNPMFSALKLHDGWLMAADVMQLDLAGTLVTLSACESGRSQVIAGDEIMGLTRAFLGAGAATLVVSLWLVQDETTGELMATWYAQLRDQVGRAAALRAAQLALKAQYAHPYYWAPFVLVGQR
ncbi:MAG: CHAT domain-containing protein [Anaerolineae bacterium]